MIPWKQAPKQGLSTNSLLARWSQKHWWGSKEKREDKASSEGEAKTQVITVPPGVRADSQRIVHGWPASASPGHWLEMQMLRSHSRPTKSETLHVGPEICPPKLCGDFDAHSNLRTDELGSFGTDAEQLFPCYPVGEMLAGIFIHHLPSIITEDCWKRV